MAFTGKEMELEIIVLKSDSEWSICFLSSADPKMCAWEEEVWDIKLERGHEKEGRDLNVRKG